MRSYDVIIIGAGVSGLAAARNLILNGFDVLVLEARDYIGGRVVSEHFAGATVDLGASWIHGVEENPITRLATKHDIATQRSQMCGPSPDNILHRTIFDENFTRLTHEAKLEIASVMADFLDYLSSVQSEDDLHLKSISDLKRCFMILYGDKAEKYQQHIDYLVDTIFLYEFAVEADDLSAESYHADHDFAGHDRLFPKGYGQIAYVLAQGVDILLNQVVQQIEYSADMAKVITQDQQYSASYVLVSVPLGVLKRGDIGFEPYLPRLKREALHALQMGTLNKIYLAFDHVFWDKQAQSIACLSDQHKIAREMINLYPMTERPILAAFTAGEFAESMERLSDQELVDLVIDALRQMYGDNIPAPVHHRITRWHQDPFSYGSYSYLPVDVKASQRAHLAEAIDSKVFFAGEATSVYFPSTVHGAFLSGVRAAYEILQTDLLTEDIRRKTAKLEKVYL
ncbi:flavin monoamine oxidase family protein [Facilibium subflavum]|uniref:flavin monoamine oxidase family protein n=1 Tax=Facilibium subflavum TaxID=2219058 RepID=UPI0013C2C057|nr:FAD-dependent oxidoreductase [Facilibium subflavum]